MLLDVGGECGPCFSLTGIEAPALIAFAQEDVNEDAIAAADVDEAWEWKSLVMSIFFDLVTRRAIVLIHILPQLNQKSRDTEILEHVLTWFCLLHPCIAQPLRMFRLQLRICVLHSLLGDQLIMLYTFGITCQLPLPVFA